MSDVRFSKLETSLDFPKEEAEILAFWKNNGIFAKSLELSKRRAAQTGLGEFVFYEGPPTANGMPHNGHVLTRVMKDLFPRYKTMRGYHVPRKAGWDTHGLPVEVEVEKELRIHGKAAIEEHGVEPFVRRCIDSVFRYQHEWEKLTERIGFWVDLDEAYVTYHKSYVESVWWALGQLFDKGLLYQGHKVVWWWAQGGTALSAAEVGQGYKTVDDPSAYVLFPLVAGAANDHEGSGVATAENLLAGANLVVWTTTPWTLPSNMFAAVRRDARYVVAELAGEGAPLRVVVAEVLLEPLSKKLGREAMVLRALTGQELVGLRYQPPFDWYRTSDAHPALWKVRAADFVTLDSGTGIVHIAPAFGEDDHGLYRRVQAEHFDLPLLCAVEADGSFSAQFAPYAGRWVKSCDKDLLAELRSRGSLLHHENYRHEYPFCWRADDDALIQFARPAWYIRTTAKIDEAKANNQAVNWFPEHIKTGRFGDFLANNVDWALSRERYWGTPLPIWVNDVTGNKVVVKSCDEILAKNPMAFEHFHAARAKDPSLSEHLIVHKPWIDAVTWQEPGEEGTYRRVGDVIDCWFDSGCMPFAQWGYPHQGEAEMKASFPADFISEAIDQTRGWFYSLLMISSLVLDAETRQKLGLSGAEYPHPYKNCIVLGHVTDRDGKKESKSKGNYTPPDVILDSVRMEFAVLERHGEVSGKAGTALIAREDLEGLDLQDGARVRLTGQAGASVELELRAAKKLPRRLVVLDAATINALGAEVTHKPDVRAVEVPALPAAERVWVQDLATAAPGADAFRWFFYAANPPWNSTRHSLSNVRELQKETLLRLRNVVSFFVIYANIDEYPAWLASRGEAETQGRTELDRWVLSELSRTVAQVTLALDGYDVHGATQCLTRFVDGLSNWYVRRARARFWAPGELCGEGANLDKRAAFDTLYECLVTLSKLMAPFTPFAAESLHQNLVRRGTGGVVGQESVHLESWPTPAHTIDDALLARMQLVRELVSLGLQVRTSAKQKVRQPLAKASLVVSDRVLREALRDYTALIAEELNVLEVELLDDDQAGTYVSYVPKPNFRALGQKGMGREAQALKKAMTGLDAKRAEALVHALTHEGRAQFDGIELSAEDVEIAFETKDGYAAAGSRAGVVVLDTRLTEDLLDRGLVREITSRVQAARKDAGFDFADRIRLAVEGGERVQRLLANPAHCQELLYGTQADELTLCASLPEATPIEASIEGETVRFALLRVV